MKTIFLVEKDDLALLRSGQPWDLQIGGTTVTLQMVGKQVHPPAPTPVPNGKNGKPVLRRDYTPTFKAKVLADYARDKKGQRVATKYGIRRDLVYSWAHYAKKEAK